MHVRQARVLVDWHVPIGTAVKHPLGLVNRFSAVESPDRIPWDRVAMRPQPKHYHEELGVICFAEQVLPSVGEAVPQERKQVSGHEGRHDLLDDFDNVDDPAVVRDFVVTRHVLVEVLHEREEHVVLDKVGRNAQQTQLLQHEPVAKNVFVRVTVVPRH